MYTYIETNNESKIKINEIQKTSDKALQDMSLSLTYILKKSQFFLANPKSEAEKNHK